MFVIILIVLNSLLLEKLFLANTRYKTRKKELLFIIKIFKIWPHYLKDFKYKVLIITNYNNLY